MEQHILNLAYLERHKLKLTGTYLTDFGWTRQG